MTKSVLTFDVEMAQRLKSISATILLSYFQTRAMKDGNEIKVNANQIERETFLTRRQQVKARKILAEHGYLLEKKIGMPATLHYVLSFKEELILQSQVEPPSPAALCLDLRVDFTRSAILGGEFDKRPAHVNLSDLRMVEFMLMEWAEAWGKNLNRLTVNAERKKIWKKAIKDKIKPSDFLKAIWGMKHDPWEERKNRCGWTYVFRHWERWVEMFEEFGFQVADMTKMKTIRGVVVPLDYSWDQSDDNLKQLGNRFDPIARRWVSKTSKQFDSLLKYNNGEDRHGKNGSNSWRSFNSKKK